MRGQLTGTKKIRCPRCDVEMADRPLTLHIRADDCPQCGGIWLEHGALKEYCRARLSERANPENLRRATRTRLQCPNCGLALFDKPFPPGSGIPIQQCNRCAGIFLDAGRLEQIKAFVERRRKAKKRARRAERKKGSQ